MSTALAPGDADAGSGAMKLHVVAPIDHRLESSIAKEPSLLTDTPVSTQPGIAPPTNKTSMALDTPHGLLNFFERSCTPPSLTVEIWGHRTKGTGTVEDFRLNWDLASYIVPYGFMHPIQKGVTLEQCLDSYIKSTSPIKTLTMRKHVEWPYRAMKDRLIAECRAKGYEHEVDVRFTLSNNKVKIQADTTANRIALHPVGNVCCAPCMWPMANQEKKLNGVRTFRATFHMSVSLEEWMVDNKGSIHLARKLSTI